MDRGRIRCQRRRPGNGRDLLRDDVGDPRLDAHPAGRADARLRDRRRRFGERRRPGGSRLRPGESNVDLALAGGAERPGTGSFTVPSVPIEWTGTDPIFGAVTKGASGVEFRPGTENVDYDLGRSPVPGTIVPVPPSLGSFDFDLFFIDLPAGYGELGGRVIALGVDAEDEVSPPPVGEPRPDDVELAGDAFGQRISRPIRRKLRGRHRVHPRHDRRRGQRAALPEADRDVARR